MAKHVLKPQEVVAILGRLGFVEVRQRGAHKQFRHVDGRGTTVPYHKGRDVSPLSSVRSPRTLACVLTISCNAKPNEKEAPPGFEPGMADLQSTALPLG